MKAILLISFYVLVHFSGNAQPGALDANFGNSGKVVTNVDQTRNVTNSVLVQADGKIVVVGYCTPIDYSGYFTLTRYNTDGSLDNGFGSNGVVTTTINGNEDIAFSGAIQADGKIIAAGYTWTGVTYDFAMVRYNLDGTRDMTFGAAGIVTTDISGGQDKANQVLVQANGDIIMIGYTSDEGASGLDMAFARYSSDGSLDQGFGADGKVRISVSEPDLLESARAAVLQPDGKLVAVGYADSYDALNSTLDIILTSVRLNIDGSLDATFGNSGIVKMAIEKRAVGTAVALTQEGKILISAETKTTKYGTTDFTLLRLDNLGLLDISFGENGFRTTSFDNSDDSGSALFIQSDQKILAAGYTSVNNGSTVDFALARFDIDGNLDNTFGNEGKVTVDFQGGLDFGAAIALQKNGKIIMAGSVRVGTDYDFGLVRLLNDSALPVTLVAFGAEVEDSNVHLSWETSSESNADYFEIQKSKDGKQWKVLGTSAATNFTPIRTSYSYVDQRPATGNNYYRLKMVDFDKSFTYSAVASVNCTGNADELSVHPNPTSGKLFVDMDENSRIKAIQIFDTKGNQVTRFSVTANNVDLRSLPDGRYNIVITDDRGGVVKNKVVLIK